MTGGGAYYYFEFVVCRPVTPWSMKLMLLVESNLKGWGKTVVLGVDKVDTMFTNNSLETHGEVVESHPHNHETWNKVTRVNRDNTHEAGKSCDPIFVLTGIPSTPSTATSYPPNAIVVACCVKMSYNGFKYGDLYVEVLQKYFGELKEARTQYKELFEEAKEENRRHYEEKLKKN
nr:hypothetical protein [Tanacetum cinerariifolium]